MCRRSPPLFLFMAFFLLFAQQAGAAHAIGHAFEDLKQHDAKHAVSVCDKCENYAQFNHALGGTAPVVAQSLATGTAIVPIPVVFHSPSVIAADARGPPSLL
jgi:hypothetical protein